MINRVYLSGTITADPACVEWRKRAEALLGWKQVAANPLRKKDIATLSKDGLTGPMPASLFVERDLQDIRQCDAMIVYFMKKDGLERQSIGTWAELGIAIERRVPFVVVTDDPAVAGHPFIQRFAVKVVDTIEEAVKTVQWLD